MRKTRILIIALCLMVLLTITEGCKTKDKDSSQEATPDISGTQDSSYNTEEAEPLQIFIDVEYGSSVYLKVKDKLSEYMSEGDRTVSFATRIKDMGGPSSIELEIPPVQGDKRETYLTRLRTEIMAGGGPDVFVCMSGMGYHEDQKTHEYIESEPLFRFPQQAMKRNMFLALDDYIDKAQFMEWDKLTPVIMDTGKTEKGRFLLPMTYTVPVTIFQSSDVEHTQSKNVKWEDMLASDPQMCLAAVKEVSPNMVAALAPMADYVNDKLAVSEDEMARFINEKADNMQKYEDESNVPRARFNLKVVDSFKPSNYDDRFNDDEHFTMIPLYSRSGGSAAIITSFAAVNANTKHPDDAFFILDYLLSEECQRSSLYSFVTADMAVPTMEGLMTHGTSVGGVDGNFTMSDNYYEQFCAVRDTINYADFATPLDRELQQLYIDLLEPSNKSRETAIHNAYMRMNMMLAES